MSPVTHFLTGWVLACGVDIGKRGRACITLAAVVPDIDGIGAIPDFLTRNTQHSSDFFTTYHHSLHNIGFAVLVAALAIALSRRADRGKVGLLSFLAVNLHLLEDLVGSRGPDGFQWPIRYFEPFVRGAALAWQGQWALNAWPNYVITLILLLLTFWLAWAKGLSPLEFVSARADAAFVETLRHRFPKVAD